MRPNVYLCLVMLSFLFPFIFAFGAVGNGEDGESTCEHAEGTGCSNPDAPPFWPFKNRDLNRSGLSPHLAPFNLTTPVWTWQEPDEYYAKWGTHGVIYSSPILDGNFNSYIQSTSGGIYSHDRHGLLRWALRVGKESPGNLALLDGVLYTGDGDGVAHAIRAIDGSRVWSVKIGKTTPDDAWAAVAFNGTVIVQATEGGRKAGGEEVVALRTTDGQVEWRYNVAKRAGTVTYNCLPAIVDGSVVFDDWSGGVYRLSFETGEEQWAKPGPNPGVPSTGGMAVGPQNVVYTARNRHTRPSSVNGNDGFVRAHDLSTGRLLWHHSFPIAMNVGLAVGQLKPGGPLVVIAVPGDIDVVYPTKPWFWPDYFIESWYRLPIPLLRNFWYWLERHYYAKESDKVSGIVALDANTGGEVWRFDLSWKDYALPSYPLRWVNFACVPDIAGNPAIGADGTVYVSWSGGKVFAIRDANEDGKISAADPREVSFYATGHGSNGNPAIAPGYVVFPHCNGLAAFAT